MAVKNQEIQKNYALYNGDCIEVMDTLPDNSIDMSIYSPPFANGRGGLYNYSSHEQDLSNCKSYHEFFEHYEYVVEQKTRITKPGRMSGVHCWDVPKEGANVGGLIDFPGDIIRLHERLGWELWTRRHIWKEPLAVRNRTMSKGLAHRQICEDSLLTTVAGSDYLLQFRKKGINETPVTHTVGLTRYAGSDIMPQDNAKYRGYEGDQKKNKYSHWIWRQYASSNWYDIRIERTLPYKESKDPEDEKHVHPLQLDVIERACVLWSKPGEVILTPFMGVGSEVYGAVINGRKGVGIELKPSYYSQACRNLNEAMIDSAHIEQPELFS